MFTKKMKTVLLLLVLFCFANNINATPRWHILDNGAIEWQVDSRLPHYDHIEMSGLKASVVLRYGVNGDGQFVMERSMIWPMLRTIPNNTHASLMQRFAIDYASLLLVNDMSLNNEKVKSICIDGRLTVVSLFAIGYQNTGTARNRKSAPVVELTRSFFPSTDKPMLCERYTVKNISSKPISVVVPSQKAVYHTDPAKGVDGAYKIVTSIQSEENCLYTIAPKESVTFDASVQAYKKGETELIVDMTDEEQKRMAFVDKVWSNLNLVSPDPVVNTAFAFAKVRAAESIFATGGGLMHSPGGESYYAAIWANDQAEYANPFFPFLGYDTGNASALNSFRHFARFMSPDYSPIPSSIIAEGQDIWNGAGDRGDAAMIAYGAARYALARADRNEAQELWALIEWCLEFCRRKINDSGVVASDADELEGRFPAGDANLCTSSLYYDALVSASYLAKELGKQSSVSKEYARQAKVLRNNINKHFGCHIEGFDSYRYYEGNDILRSWIAIPLTVGIFEQKEGTVEALFSPRLWTKDGLLTQAGTDTFWDRSTLYALRGVYSAGARDKAMEHMSYYSQQRLLGEHVPYPIEAWPEGNQRHLSAESALYCRVVTEGIFGIRPTGFHSFSLCPQLPDQWNSMELKNISAFTSSPFDISVERQGNKIKTCVLRNGKTVRTYHTVNGKEINVIL